MTLMSKILNLKKGEGRVVIFPMIYSFFAGAALSLFVASSTSLFLSSFERKFLPISFIAAGILVWLVGKLLNYLQNKFDFTKSLPAGIGILLISITILLISYRIFELSIIIFLLYAWIRVFAYIHAVSFWSLAGKLFSLRQAKRIFGLITGGEVFASILSFFSIPLLLKFIKTTDILFISGIFLTFAFVFILFIVRRFSTELSFRKIKNKNDKDSGENLFKSKYYKLIFLIAFVPIFAQFFVDFIFQAQAKVEFPDREELTAFVGIFFGISAVIEFLLKTFVSGRLLNQYGVKLGLLVFPVVLLISFFFASIFGIFFGVMGLFFSFVVLGRLFTRAVRTSFNDPTTQILFLPLPDEQRLLIQNKIESGPKAYASIIAGIFLLILVYIPNVSLVLFAIILFFVTIYWIKVALDTFKQYKIKIQDVLTYSSQKKKLTTYDKIKAYFENKENNNLSLNLFFHQIFNLHESQHVKKYKLHDLSLLSNSSSKRERIIAAKELSRFSIYKTEKLYIKLLNDCDYNVRCQAIITVAENKQKELFEYLLYNFKLNSYREIVFHAILKIGNSILPDVINMFSSFNYDTNIQLKILEILEQNSSTIAVKFLRKLIYHHNRLIKDKALEVLANLNYNASNTEKLKINILLEEKIKSYVYLAASVIDLKEKAENYFSLINALNDKKSRQKKAVFSILSVLYNKKAIVLIENNLDTGDEKSKGFALEVADTVISDLHKQLLLPFFESLNNHELVRRYRFKFSNEKLSNEERLIDILNADINTTGSYVKVETIKLLINFNSHKVISVLKTNLVHPLKYIREAVAISLNQLNHSEFLETIEAYQTTNKFLNDLKEMVNVASSSGNLLIYEKIELLKSLPLFENIGFNNLFLLANESKEQVIFENNELILEGENEIFGLIVISGQLNFGGHIFESGDIINPYLFSYSKKKEIIAKEQTFVFKVPFYNINSVFFNNYEFALKIINKYEFTSV